MGNFTSALLGKIHAALTHAGDDHGPRAVSAYDVIALEQVDGLTVEKDCPAELLEPFRTRRMSIVTA